MNSLAQFPREILAHILLGPHCSFLSIVLWKCGDRLLQEKLSQCITSIDLKDETQVPLSRWPDCLSRFVNLRHLSIVLSNGYLAGSSSDLQDFMLSLSPKLEELVVISRDLVLASPGNSVICSTSTSFESLLKLEMPCHAHKDFQNKHPFYQLLTRNIRDLSLFYHPGSSLGSETVMDHSIAGLVDNWPPHLETLRNHSLVFDERFSSLPTLKTVESLILGSYLVGFHQYSPTKLDMHAPWTLELSLLVPDTVTELSLRVIGDCGDKKWSQTIPRRLESLKLSLSQRDFDHEVTRHLPPTLTKLAGGFVWSGNESSPMIDLPNLKIMQMWYDMGAIFASKLPPSVTEYTHPGSYSHHFPLPPSVTSAQFESIIARPITAPLRTLSVAIHFDFDDIEALPLTLTTLHLPLVLSRPFTFNLPLLTALSLSRVHVDVFKFLPRSLTSLVCFIESFGSDTESDVACFRELPTGLKLLNVKTEAFRKHRISSLCFSPCVSLERLITNLVLDIGICEVVKAHLHKIRYLEFVIDDGGRDQYTNGFPSRLVLFAPRDDGSRSVKYAVLPKPKSATVNQ